MTGPSYDPPTAAPTPIPDATGHIWPLVAMLCLAQILSMAGFANFVALIPTFSEA